MSIIHMYGDVYNKKEGGQIDGKVLDVPTGSDHPGRVLIQFMIGDCPYMPRDPKRCDYFLRFGSKILGEKQYARQWRQSLWIRRVPEVSL